MLSRPANKAVASYVATLRPAKVKRALRNFLKSLGQENTMPMSHQTAYHLNMNYFN